VDLVDLLAAHMEVLVVYMVAAVVVVTGINLEVARLLVRQAVMEQ
jgi:hypothetical protein